MIKTTNFAKGQHVIYVLIYFMISTIIKYALRNMGIEGANTIFSFINVGIIFIIFISQLFLKKNKLTVEKIVSLVILLSSLIFTLLSKGFLSSILAVGINLFLLYTAFIADDLILDSSYLAKICKLVVVFALGVILFSIIKDKPFSQLIGLKNAYHFSFMGIWNSKNQFGRFLFCSAACNFYIIVFNLKNKKSFLFYLGTLVAISVCILLTFSRAALLSYVVFCLVFILLYNRKRFITNFFIITFLILVWLILNIIEFVSNFINSIVLRTDTATIDNRSVLWKIGLYYFQNHIFIGSGEYMAESILKASGSQITEFHNAYINRLVVSGLIVFGLYVFLFFKRFVLMIKRIKSPYIVICLALFFGILAYMFFL